MASDPKLINQIIAWETNGLSARETIQFFSKLVKSGMAWKLQGMYGRQADALIKNGYLSKNGKILKLPK